MMRIIYDEKTLKEFMKEVMAFDSQHPVLIDKYIMGIEAEVDAVCDGKDVFIPGIMQLVERTGVHSGDSMSVYPPYTLSEEVQKTIVEDTVKIGLALNMVGLFNIQFIVQPNGDVSIIEVNPRSSRTVPFLAKSTGAPIADIAAQVMLGHSLKELGYVGLYPKKKRWYVKTPIFSFSKIQGMDIVLSPEMKSTGEAIGYDHDFNKALYKSLRASGQKLINYGTVFTTIADKDKEAALPLIRRFYNLGFNVEATKGTAEYLKEQGIKTRIRKKISEGSEEILDSLRKGYVSYVINTMTDDADDTISEARENFLDAYHKKYGNKQDPEDAVALGYDAYGIAIDAVLKAEELEAAAPEATAAADATDAEDADAEDAADSRPSGESIRSVLADSTYEFDGASGVIRFNKRGDPKKTAFISTWNQGAITSIYTIEADEQ